MRVPRGIIFYYENGLKVIPSLSAMAWNLKQLSMVECRMERANHKIGYISVSVIFTKKLILGIFWALNIFLVGSAGEKI